MVMFSTVLKRSPFKNAKSFRASLCICYSSGVSIRHLPSLGVFELAFDVKKFLLGIGIIIFFGACRRLEIFARCIIRIFLPEGIISLFQSGAFSWGISTAFASHGSHKLV